MTTLSWKRWGVTRVLTCEAPACARYGLSANAEVGGGEALSGVWLGGKEVMPAAALCVLGCPKVVGESSIRLLLD